MSILELIQETEIIPNYQLNVKDIHSNNLLTKTHLRTLFKLNFLHDTGCTEL